MATVPNPPESPAHVGAEPDAPPASPRGPTTQLDCAEILLPFRAYLGHAELDAVLATLTEGRCPSAGHHIKLAGAYNRLRCWGLVL